MQQKNNIRIKILVVFLLFISNSPLYALTSSHGKDTTIILKTAHGELTVKKTFDLNSSLFMLNARIDISQEIIEECENRKILTDIIKLEMIFNDSCSINSIKIKHKGKIESFNKYVELYCLELLEEIKVKDIFKGGPCNNWIFPVKLTIY